MTVGENIKKYRIQRSMTQKELGEKLGITQQMIGQYESGARNPKLATIRKIADALGVTMNVFLDGHWLEYQDEMKHDFDTKSDIINDLVNKIDKLGYIFKSDNEGNAWIEYQDGDLAVSQEQLLQISENCDSFLKFKLEELKQKNLNNFKLKK